MLKLILIALSLVLVIVVTLRHIPLWLSRSVMRFVPLWVQTIGVHAFGYMIGGVTGHVAGALASVPYFFLARYWLKPRLLAERRRA